MSGDEALVSVAAFVAGPLLWILWLLRMSRLPRFNRRRTAVTVIGAALIVSAAILLIVLKTGASFDVVDAPSYLAMYVVLGLAWSRLTAMTFPLLGVSLRDDVVERRNTAALLAAIGAILGVTLCYAGGNIGDGPGWWVVIFSAALATATLLMLWAALNHLSPAADSIAIDRDPAAGMRVGAFLLACGLVLGRGVAGDWDSALGTVRDFLVALPPVAVLLVLAIVVERASRPTALRPASPPVRLGVLPSVVYLLAAIGSISLMGPER